MTDKLEKRWIYRIVDASYRVHTRLYKVQYDLIHVERTTFTLLKNITITVAPTIMIILLGFIYFFVDITKIELTKENYIVLSLIIIALLIVYGYQIKLAKDADDDIEKISKEIKNDGLEKWPDFLADEASKWGTRILMAKEVLEENEIAFLDKQSEAYMLNKKTFTNVLKISLAKIEEIKKSCEGSILEENYKNYITDICDEFTKLGRKEYDKWNTW